MNKATHNMHIPWFNKIKLEKLSKKLSFQTPPESRTMELKKGSCYQINSFKLKKNWRSMRHWIRRLTLQRHSYLKLKISPEKNFSYLWKGQDIWMIMKISSFGIVLGEIGSKQCWWETSSSICSFLNVWQFTGSTHLLSKSMKKLSNTQLMKSCPSSLEAVSCFQLLSI